MLLLAPVATLNAGDRFWETKAPAEWSDAELDELLTSSPWAQQAISGKQDSGVQAYLASARPIRDAEDERERRNKDKQPLEDPTAGEYREYLAANAGKVIVVAIRGASIKALSDAAEVKRMEDRCELRVGGKKYKMIGHFPPSPSDEWLRIVFPRVVTDADVTFRVYLYVPGAKEPYRFAEFRTKEMLYNGRLEL